MRPISVGIMFVLIVLNGCGRGIGTMQPSPVVGVMVRSQLPESFQEVYDTVTIQSEVVPLLRQAGAGVETKVFLGTWCPDSRREVPRFLKVVDAVGPTLGEVTLIGLDRSKKSPGGLEVPYNIERVPTFIFFKKGKEIGRVVEVPQTTIEADMVTIVAREENQ